MRKAMVALVAMLASAPAAATQGFSCEAKGISLDLNYGHAVNASLANHELRVGDKVVVSEVAQSWAGDNFRWIDLADDGVMNLIAKVRLEWVREAWRGTIAYGGTTYALNCEETG